MMNAAPYGVLTVTPNYQKQLTICPPFPRLIDAPQAFSRLPSGGYLFVQRSDLFSTSTNPPSVNVLEFDASIRLVSQSSFMLSGGTANPGTANRLALADVNGDGFPDLIVGAEYEFGADVQVLLGNGHSSFGNPVIYNLPNERDVVATAVADLNGDNRPDIVVAGYFTGQIWTFLGNGDGTFHLGQTLSTNPAPETGALAIAIGDLNGDKKPDLVYTTSDPAAILVAMGNGDGTFGTPVSFPSTGSYSVAIGDVNGDGFPDIVSSGVSILLGDGKGGFPQRRDYYQPTDGNVILTDFDGDGKTDIVQGVGAPWVLSGAGVSVLYGGGDGTFSGAPVSLVPGLTSGDSDLGIAIKAADLNGDGIQDLVFSDLFSGLTALLGNGNGEFKPAWQRFFATGPNNGFADSIAIGDFNRDGIPDFAAAISGDVSRIEIYLGIGDGTFQPPFVLSIGSSITYGDLVVGDFNNDGKLDLVAAVGPPATDGASSVDVFPGNGDGTFAAPISFPVSADLVTIASGDFNNDGVLDLVLTTSPRTGGSGVVQIMLGKGDGTFTQGASVSLPNIQSASQTILPADFNLDGKIDLAITLESPDAANGQLAVLLGNGDGTFQPAVFGPLQSSSLTAADVNGDGMPDIVGGAADGVYGQFGYLLGNGDGTFQPEVLLDGLIGPLVVADLNGDGQPDIAGSGPAIVGFRNLSQSGSFAIVSAASFQAGPVAPESLVSAFASGLPSTIDRASVTVQDASGITRSATVLYASPAQINFEVPAGVSPGIARFAITDNSTSPALSFTSRGQIAPVAPAIFQLNKAALAAAYSVRVSGNSQSIEPIYSIQNGVAVPLPIDLGSASDQVYLCLFGTGFRNAATSQVSVRINGITAPVTYAGPQPGFLGLDQINVLLPRQLAGVGQAGIVVTASGYVANTAYVFFK